MRFCQQQAEPWLASRSSLTEQLLRAPQAGCIYVHDLIFIFVTTLHSKYYGSTFKYKETETRPTQCSWLADGGELKASSSEAQACALLIALPNVLTRRPRATRNVREQGRDHENK